MQIVIFIRSRFSNLVSFTKKSILQQAVGELKTPMKALTDKNYRKFLSEVKQRIQSAKLQVARSINTELIKLYFNVGKLIVEKQERFGWGKSIVEQLASDLQGEYDPTGYSVQNLWYMRQLYMEYKDFPKLQQLVGEIPWGRIF